MEDIEEGIMAERLRAKYDIIIAYNKEDFKKKINYLEKSDVGAILWEGFQASELSNNQIFFCVPVMVPLDFKWPKQYE